MQSRSLGPLLKTSGTLTASLINLLPTYLDLIDPWLLSRNIFRESRWVEIALPQGQVLP